jgi:hypothetical protein
MKIINVNTSEILEVVDFMPKKGQIGKAQANIMLAKDHKDDGGKWAEVEEVETPKEEKPKRKRRTRKPKEETL